MSRGGVTINLDFEKYGTEVAANMAQRVSAEIARRAKRKVRRKTGELRNSIKVIGVTRFKFLVLAQTPYAAMQEWGPPDTPYWSKRGYSWTPYLTPSAEEVVQEDVMRKILREAEIGAARKAARKHG
jgi:hypothetical protein